MILMDVNEVFITCVDIWAKDGFDDRIDNAIDQFDEWINNFNKDERELLAKLLQKFNYYSKSHIADIIRRLSEESIERCGISNADSVISVVRKVDGKYNSSYDYWILHRGVSGFSKEIYYDSVDDIDEMEWNSIKKVVYVDDCSGTGKQFVKFMKRQRKSFLNKKVVLIIIEAVEDAKIYIESELKKERIDIEIISYTTKEKALKNMVEKERKTFYSISKKQQISKEYIYGFENAEALMSFYNNTPNDTLGLFWFPSEENNPIFPRNLEEKPGWKLKNDKAKRRRQQYETKCS